MDNDVVTVMNNVVVSKLDRARGCGVVDIDPFARSKTLLMAGPADIELLYVPAMGE